MSPPHHLVVMGVSGSGKTTVAVLLAKRLRHPFAEADEFHPRANIDKMTAGTALTDADRLPWLTAMRDWLSRRTSDGTSAIVTCSALKRSYRDLLREAEGQVSFVHLAGDEAMLAARLGGRSGHFMPASLLPSQLQTLEPLGADEAGITVTVDRTPEQIVEDVLAWLHTEQVSDPTDLPSGPPSRET